MSEAQDAYTAAVAAVCAGTDPGEALRRAVAADPANVIAAADLAAWTRQPDPGGAGRTSWERRHLEIVRAASTDPARAEVLLREHATTSGCDPLALVIVARTIDGLDSDRLADLRGRSCTCWM
jgi:hypothetical protein